MELPMWFENDHYLNFLKDEPNIDLINFNEDEDTALFIDKNNYKKKDSNSSFNKYIINDSTNEEMNLQKDEGIKRINEFNTSLKHSFNWLYVTNFFFINKNNSVISNDNIDEIKTFIEDGEIKDFKQNNPSIPKIP